MKRLLIVLLFPILTLTSMTAQTTPEHIVQANLDAYNAGDIDAFMSYFSPDITIYNHADREQTAQGIEAVRAIYEPYFKASPNLHSKILKRIVIGNKVIDHESITGRYGSDDVLLLVLIYEVENEKINAITVIRE